MNKRLVIFVVLLVLFSSFVSAATLHGAVYDESLQLITNVQLEINSTPKQNHISNNGLYFFNVPLGTYEIIVEKYIQKKLVYHGEKVIDVPKDGEFRIDIIIEQVSEEPIPEEEDLGPSFLTLLRAKYSIFLYVGLALIIILAIILIVFYVRSTLKKNNKEVMSVVQEVISVKEKVENLSKETNNSENKETKNETPKDKKEEEKPVFESGTLESVLKIIKEEGGRTTQKNIRKKIPLSEAKISLMISELEAAGKVKKIKKGRGNIIVLQ
jgi:uncharacterized membrane protein